MPATHEQIRQAVWDTVRKTLNKFRENPYYFFTESDIHSYFYHCLYSANYEVERDGRRIYLIHREYPTNFRYSKAALVLPTYNEPYPLSTREGDRGNFDIAVINPDFVTSAPSIENIVNKNVRLVQERVETDLTSVRRELLFAIEFKYVIRNSISFVTEVLQDNKKLLFAKQWGAGEAINLVFCNMEGSNVQQVRDAVVQAPGDIHAFFAQAYYENDKKKSPRLISNVQDAKYAWLADERQ
jgi:hypothetical protein